MKIALEEIGPVMGAAAVLGITLTVTETVTITVTKVNFMHLRLHVDFQNTQNNDNCGNVR